MRQVLLMQGVFLVILTWDKFKVKSQKFEVSDFCLLFYPVLWGWDCRVTLLLADSNYKIFIEIRILF